LQKKKEKKNCCYRKVNTFFSWFPPLIRSSEDRTISPASVVPEDDSKVWQPQNCDGWAHKNTKRDLGILWSEEKKN
jgi:hypothetical protein